MASKHVRRKVAKAKSGRASKMQEEGDFELDNISPTANLMSGNSAETKRSPTRRLWLAIGAVLGVCVLVTLISIAGVLTWSENKSANGSPAELRKHDPAYGLSTNQVFLSHQASTLSRASIMNVTRAVSRNDLLNQELNPLLIKRVSGTPGNVEARNHIVSRLQSLGGWDIKLDSFQDQTPFGMKPFANIIATANPSVNRRLVLACHYDSKYFTDIDFIGATDSAVPCSQLLYLARSLDAALKQANSSYPPVTLQLLFLDGEEAFVEWTRTDSIYGARHLAEQMFGTPHPAGARSTNLLDGIDMFVLLDLLGTRNPKIPNFFESTSTWYESLASIETRLKRSGLLENHSSFIFNRRQRYNNGIQDDHIPFLQRGVRVLHLIASPFPWVWHTVHDNASNLDYPTIINLSKILHVFVAEYLSLPV